MPHAIRIHEIGGPEVMCWEEIDPGPPGTGNIRIRTTAIGVNYIDTYQRSGLYKVSLPSGLGMEGAGVITALGEGVSDLQKGQRIAFSGGGFGAYAEELVIPAKLAVPLPDAIDDVTAAGVLMKGGTVEALLRHVRPVKPGETILWHAAAGGVGLIAVQWAKHLGVTVIGTAGSDEKVNLAKSHGCDHVINYSRENFVARVKEITAGKGVDAVFDSVGKATWPDSLDCLRPLGMMVSFGNASGPITSVEPAMLMLKGSLYFTRPSVMTFLAMPGWLASASTALFELIRSGTVKIEVGQTYALKDAAQAHRDLEARRTTGSTVLLP